MSVLYEIIRERYNTYMSNLRPILLVSSIPLFFAMSGFSFLFWKEKFAENPFPTQAIAVQEEALSEEQTITLRFVGDIMLDRGVEWRIKQNPPAGGGNDWKWPFLSIAKELQETDFLFGNLESVISDKGIKVGNIYSFRADPLAIEGLRFAGFDLLSVANNHSLDDGRAGFEDSLSRLNEAGIGYVGQKTSSEKEPSLAQVQGLKIATLAYTTQGSPAWASVEWMDLENLYRLREDIARAKILGDVVVVSFHWGDEYAKIPNDFQGMLGHEAIDAGADIVVGHHPHVVQPLEQYKQGWIAYSLGNFVFDQYFSEETMRGAILKVDIKNKTIQNAVLERTALNDSFQVTR